MTKLFTTTLTFLSILFSSLTHAQDITGLLTDEQHQAIPMANIVLLQLPDSSFVAGTTSDQAGHFRITYHGHNQLLRITSVGYTTQYHSATPGDLGNIVLQADSLLLGEVVVRGTLPKTILKGDAQVTNVQGTILERAGTTQELLNRIPGLTTSETAVNVFGSGEAEIYVNGRQLRSNSELDQLQADQIRRVEVVRNPGAQYKANVKAVIRIFTKRAQGDGFGFSDRAVLRHMNKFGFSPYNQLDLSYNHDGFYANAMLYTGRFRSGNYQDINMYTHLDDLWHQHLDVQNRYKYDNFEGTLTLNYQFNDNHSFGLRYNSDNNYNSNSLLPSNATIFRNDKLYEQSTGLGILDELSHDQTLSMYYNGEIGNWKLDFNADGLWRDKNEDNLTTEQIVGGDKNVINTHSQENSELYASKLTLTHPVWKGNLSFGTEYSYTNRTSTYINDEGQIPNSDTRIREGSYSAFTEYAFALNKLNISTGLRYEFVDYDYFEGKQRIAEQSRNFSNLFPSIALTLPIGEVQTQLSYRRGIDRPGFWQLSSNTYYINRFTYQTGNPALKPILWHDVKLNTSYRFMMLSLSYGHMKNNIFQNLETYNNQPTVAIARPVNMPSYNYVTAAIVLSPTIGIWRPQFSTSIYKQWFTITDHNGPRELNHPTWNFSLENTIELPAGFLLNVDTYLSLHGDAGNTQIKNNTFYMGASIQRDFFNKQLNVKFDVQDIFESAGQNGDIISGLRTASNHYKNLRTAKLTLRYTFNPSKNKYRGTGAGQSQKSRL